MNAMNFSLAVLAMVSASAACAQAPLADPTRPPQVAPSFARESAAAQSAPATRLQSILISPTRKLAVIDGHTVAVGGRVDEATVVQIAETHVTLRQGGELKTLELYPGIERKPVKTEKKGSSQ